MKRFVVLFNVGHLSYFQHLLGLCSFWLDSRWGFDVIRTRDNLNEIS